MTSVLHPYAALKSSGVHWLCHVPEHWHVRRLRTVAEMRVSNVDKHTKEEEFPVRLCNYVDVYKNDRITQGIAFMSATASRDEIEKFRLNRNDVVITKDSEAWDDIGVPSLVTEPADDLISGYHLAIIRPRENTYGPYLFWALRSKPTAYQFHVEAKGVTRYGLAHHGIQSALIPHPPLSEQKAIVRLLDHADEQIQRYIAGKERLIDLLEEQRQAIIHQAVTRGLDPNVQLKDSGVEWLGDVPEHWEVRRIRSITEMRVSNVDKHTKEEEIPVRLCNYTDVYKNEVIDQALEFMPATASPEEVEKFRLEEQDVLITKDSETWDDIGIPALVVEPSEDLICGYHLAILRPRDEITGSFLNLALRTQGAKVQFNIQARGVTRYGLTHNSILSVQLPLPPHQEQQAIVDYLTKANGGINETVARSQHQIDLMNEYRTRLIADVVTGQLDVREDADQLPAAPEYRPSANTEVQKSCAGHGTQRRTE